MFVRDKTDCNGRLIQGGAFRTFDMMMQTIAIVFCAALLTQQEAAAQPRDASLAGLWKFTEDDSPSVSGPLTIVRGPSGWSARVNGRSIAVTVHGKELSFVLADNQGRFRSEQAAPSMVHGAPDRMKTRTGLGFYYVATSGPKARRPPKTKFNALGAWRSRQLVVIQRGTRR